MVCMFDKYAGGYKTQQRLGPGRVVCLAPRASYIRKTEKYMASDAMSTRSPDIQHTIDRARSSN